MTLEWQGGARGFLTADGKRLEYQCFGSINEGKPVIVLLHEGLGCVALWRDFPQQLAEATGCPVFAYSRSGYGQSDPADLPRPLDYMTREAVDVLPQVLSLLGARDIVLLGHSDGATIAAIHAGTVSEPRLRGAVLIAPHFFTEPSGLRAIAAARLAFATHDLAARLGKYHRDAQHTFSGWADSWLSPEFAAWNVEEVLDTITCPVLAIQGDADPYGTLRQIDVIAERCSSEVDRLVLPGVEHAPHLESVELVLDRVANFMHYSARN